MKRYNLLAGLMFFVLAVQAQQNFTLYPMRSIPQSHLLNPANTPDSKWHIGIPALNSTYLQYSNGGFNLNKFFSAVEPAGTDTTVLNLNTLLDIMSKKNYISFKVEQSWLQGGFKFQNHYFHGSIIEKANVRISLPKDLFRFVIDGNGGALTRKNLVHAAGNEFQITGSLIVTGSGRITNGLTVTGSFNLTGSSNSVGSGHVLTYDTASGLVTYATASNIGGGNITPKVINIPRFVTMDVST
jgi:hypothetical protein